MFPWSGKFRFPGKSLRRFCLAVRAPMAPAARGKPIMGWSGIGCEADMSHFSFKALALGLLALLPECAIAGAGCCSWHGGESGLCARDGREICNDGLSPRAARAPDGTAVLSAATGMTVFPDDFLRPRAAPAAGHRLMESGSTAIPGAPAPEMPRLSLRVSTGPRAAPGPEGAWLRAGLFLRCRRVLNPERLLRRTWLTVWLLLRGKRADLRRRDSGLRPQLRLFRHEATS